MAPARLYFLRKEDKRSFETKFALRKQRGMVQAMVTNLQRRQHHAIPSPSHTPHFTQSYTHTMRRDMIRQQQYTIS